MRDEGDGIRKRTGKPNRRFTLVDAMLLILAIAVGLKILTITSHYKGLGIDQLRGTDGVFEVLKEVWRFAALSTTSFLIVLSPAIVLMRCRRPRHPLRRLVREYGAVAGMVTSALMPLGFAWPFEYERPDSLADLFYSLNACLAEVVVHSPSVCGPGVIGAWMAMKLGRSGRLGDWVDHLGIVIGGGWVFIFLGNQFLAISEYLLGLFIDV